MARRILQDKSEPTNEKKQQKAVVASVVIEQQRKDAVVGEIRTLAQLKRSEEEKLDRKKEVLSSLQSQIAGLEGIISGLRTQREEFAASMSREKAAMTDELSRVTSTLTVNRDLLKEATSKLNNSRIVFANNEASAKNALSDLVYKNKQAQEELDKFFSTTQSVEKNIVTLQERSDELMTVIYARERQLQSIEDSIRAISSERSKVELQLIESQKELATMRSQIDSKNAELKEKDAEMTKKDAEITKLSNQIIARARQEERVNELIPRIRELYERAGIKIDI